MWRRVTAQALMRPRNGTGALAPHTSKLCGADLLETDNGNSRQPLGKSSRGLGVVPTATPALPSIVK
jgi:hypothetical protein